MVAPYTIASCYGILLFVPLDTYSIIYTVQTYEIIIFSQKKNKSHSFYNKNWVWYNTYMHYDNFNQLELYEGETMNRIELKQKSKNNWSTKVL